MFRPLDATLLPTVPVEDYRTCIFKPLDAVLLPTVPVEAYRTCIATLLQPAAWAVARLLPPPRPSPPARMSLKV